MGEAVVNIVFACTCLFVSACVYILCDKLFERDEYLLGSAFAMLSFVIGMIGIVLLLVNS